MYFGPPYFFISFLEYPGPLALPPPQPVGGVPHQVDHADTLPSSARNVLRHPPAAGPARLLGQLPSLILETEYTIDHPRGLPGFIEDVVTILVTRSHLQQFPLLLDPHQLQPAAFYQAGDRFYRANPSANLLIPHFQSSVLILQIVAQSGNPSNNNAETYYVPAWRPSSIHGNTGAAKAFQDIWVFGRICQDERGWPGVLLRPLLCRNDSPDSEVILILLDLPVFVLLQIFVPSDELALSLQQAFDLEVCLHRQNNP